MMQNILAWGTDTVLVHFGAERFNSQYSHFTKVSSQYSVITSDSQRIFRVTSDDWTTKLFQTRINSTNLTADTNINEHFWIITEVNFSNIT